MAKKQKKGKSAPRIKDFLDMIAPAAVKFNTDSYILGSSYRCTLALRSYPTTTEELALLCHLGEKSGVALHIYIRQATAGEEDAIIHNAQNKNRMDRGSTNNMRRSINAEANLQDVESLITTMRRNKEPLVHCAVFIELTARDADGLRSLRDEVSATPAKTIPTASTSTGTATAPTSSWTWTAGRRTRPTPTSSSWATLARVRVSF